MPDALTEALFTIFRAVATFVGAFIGWVLGGPLTRLAYRLAARRPAPGWLPPLGKLGGALLIAALIWYHLPFGGGPGWGFGGSGLGAGSGEGAGPGKGKSKTSVEGEGHGNTETATRTKLEIELLGGANVAEGRYYLMRRKPPAKTLAEVEAEVKGQADKLEVHLVFPETEDNLATRHPAAGRLRRLLADYRIPVVEGAGK
jgi:hypothetical protein